MKKECPPKCKENFLAVPEAILAIPFAQRCFLTIIKPSLGLLTIVHFSSSIVVRSSHTFLMKGTSVDFFSCLKECTMLMLEKWYGSDWGVRRHVSTYWGVWKIIWNEFQTIMVLSQVRLWVFCTSFIDSAFKQFATKFVRILQKLWFYQVFNCVLVLQERV